MALPKKPMSENEKKAKLKVLRHARQEASDVMTQSLSGLKDPQSLKDHVKEMTKESGIDFKQDSDDIEDPKHLGKVVGRQVSYENADHSPDDQSVYDEHNLDSVEEKLKNLMRIKQGKR